MLNYFLRRAAYGVLILIGVNLFTFFLFFNVNTPDDMARLNIGGKRVTQEQIEKWKGERGYDRPLYWNAKEEGASRLTRTVLWERSISLFALDFGRSDSGRSVDIGHEIKTRMGVSLQLAVPLFILQVIASTTFALLLVFFRNSRIDFWGVVNGTRAFLPHLIASGEGHVVTMSSLFGLLSIPGQSMYNATKYAVRGFSESLREELLMAGHPVGVTVVHPGGIRTAIARNARVSWREDHDSLARMFDERLARMSPERAAEIILRGVLRGKPRVLVGLDAHLLHQFARIVGARYQDVVARRAAQMRP